ncbi:MAG TPA: epoxide hydrolase [Streptosporangiaceae bacterium]|jgi:pimeloyl-ACP methyl ester carboxylesterase
MSVAEDSAEATAIRPFTVEIPEAEIEALRARVAATRWPSKELVQDGSQGVQLATLQALARYWAADYDWRACEARLNALPQFTTDIDGVEIHFIHVKSAHENALPLIITHGWPGSVIEMLEVVGPLTDPTAHGGRAEDAFDLVLPSLPGYGFSGEPAEVGWDPGRVAQAWAELMRRLGYTRYVAQGGDQGAGVTDAMGRQAPEGLIGVHFNFLDAAPRELLMAALNLRLAFSEEDRGQFGKFTAILMRGYIAEMGEHPQTIGYPLVDSPLGLAAWMLDHDADSYEKISHAFAGGQPSGGLTRDHILDNITLYWLTGTATSSARLYWEFGRSATAAFKKPPPHVSLPVAFTVFPGEIFQAPRHWVKSAYHNLIYFNEAAKGGHFAAWEEPQLFSEELRAAFRTLR